MQNGQIYEKVDERYAAAARSDDQAYSQRVAKEFGYSQEELESIPLDANLGLSCGNPHALANLKEGETVCDLGSGAGFDVFLAAKRVGASGRAIGVDMNQEMLKRANEIKNKTNATNVSFVESRISSISLPDGVADCVISNCVINLVPEAEKPAVFNEIFRILKPGGRMAVSDILAKKEMPPHVRNNMALYVGCIAGASQVGQYERYLADVGFKDVLLVNTNSDLNVYGEADGSNGGGTGCCSNSKGMNGCGNGASLSTSMPEPSESIDFNEFAGSFKIYAIK